MDPKVLVMPVYSRGNEIERLRGALSLARFFKAHLEVLYAQAKPSDILKPRTFGLSAEAVEQLVSVIDKDALIAQQDLHQHFEELCGDYEVEISQEPTQDRATACWREVHGTRSDLAARHGRVSDLIIIPHSQTGEATVTFEEAILHTRRPVLLVPRKMWEFKADKVLIGWDSGPEAAGAVQQALPFLSRASEVVIAVNDDAGTEKPDGEDLAWYLGYHGVRATTRVLDKAAQGPGDALLSMAADLGTDLLVTGAYSHTRLRQLILGGVTQTLLKHAPIPVLMAH